MNKLAHIMNNRDFFSKSYSALDFFVSWEDCCYTLFNPVFMKQSVCKLLHEVNCAIDAPIFVCPLM